MEGKLSSMQPKHTLSPSANLQARDLHRSYGVPNSLTWRNLFLVLNVLLTTLFLPSWHEINSLNNVSTLNTEKFLDSFCQAQLLFSAIYIFLFYSWPEPEQQILKKVHFRCSLLKYMLQWHSSASHRQILNYLFTIFYKRCLCRGKS